MYARRELPEEVQAKLPKPQGYKLLVATLNVSQKTAGGVYLPDNLKDAEQTASIIGYVVDAGPDAYRDEAKFPNGAYCQPGDFVIFRSYSGTRFKIMDEEFRLINDDTVEAVVEDPSGYKRA